MRRSFLVIGTAIVLTYSVILSGFAWAQTQRLNERVERLERLERRVAELERARADLRDIMQK